MSIKAINNYYNNFYAELAKIDAKYNDFNKIKEFLPNLPKHSQILDVGCGCGMVSQELIDLGMDVYGIEINEDALKILKKKGFKTIKHDVTEKIPFQDNYFDIILLLDILEHVFNPLQLLQEANRLLKKGGAVIISTPLYFDFIDRLRILFTGNVISYDNLCYGKELYHKFRSYNYDHIRFFRPKDILEMISICRFKVDKKKYLPLNGMVISRILRLFTFPITNNYAANMFPNLFAHSLKIRAIK